MSLAFIHDVHREEVREDPDNPIQFTPPPENCRKNKAKATRGKSQPTIVCAAGVSQPKTTQSKLHFTYSKDGAGPIFQVNEVKLQPMFGCHPELAKQFKETQDAKKEKDDPCLPALSVHVT
jgi:hypothetical protein